METKMRNFPESYDDHYQIELKNESTGSAGYTANGKDVILEPFTSRKVPYKDIYEVANTAAGKSMFMAGVFVINDNALNEHFGLPLIGKYNPNADDIIRLFKQGTLEDLEELLQYCSEPILGKIAELAVNLPLENLTFAKLIQDYSGKPILSSIEEYQENNLAPVQLDPDKGTMRSKNMSDNAKPAARTKKVVK